MTRARTSLGLLAPIFLVLGPQSPAFAQNAVEFSNFVCEIDVRPLGFTLADGTTSVFTFTSSKLCTGEASTRNVKLECNDVIPGWNLGKKTTSSFACTINGDMCGLAPRAGDPSAPFLTATDQTLTVDATGAAKLLCFYKPP